jgi:FkbM family methyltransferase
MTAALRRWARSARRRFHGLSLGMARRILLRHPAPPRTLGLQKIGTAYGGWVVPTALIKPDWICYCGGVGEDISFDLGLIERFGCVVRAFDPTPRAIAYIAQNAANEPKFDFHPVGLWSANTTLRFFAPRNPAHVSHSVVNLQRTSEFFEAPCRTIESIMQEVGDDRIDLLKLDIEGAEHEVVRAMLATGIRPTVLCLEIDQPVRVRTLWGTVRRIRSAGYALVDVDSWNVSFLRTDALEPSTARLR